MNYQISGVQLNIKLSLIVNILFLKMKLELIKSQNKHQILGKKLKYKDQGEARVSCFFFLSYNSNIWEKNIYVSL